MILIFWCIFFISIYLDAHIALRIFLFMQALLWTILEGGQHHSVDEDD